MNKKLCLNPSNFNSNHNNDFLNRRSDIRRSSNTVTRCGIVIGIKVLLTHNVRQFLGHDGWL